MLYKTQDGKQKIHQDLQQDTNSNSVALSISMEGGKLPEGLPHLNHPGSDLLRTSGSLKEILSGLNPGRTVLESCVAIFGYAALAPCEY